MTLTTEQVKQAKKICKANSIDPKMVNKELGNGFWMEECNGSFEGYISYLLNKSGKLDGSFTTKIFAKSLRDYRNGKSGRSAI